MLNSSAIRLPALVIGLVCLTAGCAGGSSRPAAVRAGTRWSFGRFSGYSWEGGPVTSVEASWIVPEVSEGAPVGLAGTWIGVVGTSGGSSAPFIQVGTNEEQVRHDGVLQPVYYAFWSDKSKGFKPFGLGNVTPATLVRARLRLAGGRWHLFIRDEGSETQADFTTRQEARDSFNRAEWLDEAVEPIASRPTVEHVRFEHLEVDGLAPAYPLLVSSWMSVGATNLAPGPLVDDSFQISPRRVSAYGASYLRMAHHVDSFDERLWRQFRTPAALAEAGQRAVRERRRLAATLVRFVRELGSLSWPAAAREAITNLRTGTQDGVEAVDSPPGTEALSRAAWTTKFERVVGASNEAAATARRALDLPQVEAG